jgi:hypothetical protein
MDVAVTVRNDAVYMTQSGDYDVDAYLRAVVELLDMPDYAEGMPIIVDACGLTTPASGQQLHAVRDALDAPEFRRFRPSRYATVTRAAVGHLHAKLAATLIATRIADSPENFAMRHFSTITDAEDWIRQTGA